MSPSWRADRFVICADFNRTLRYGIPPKPNAEPLSAQIGREVLKRHGSSPTQRRTFLLEGGNGGIHILLTELNVLRSIQLGFDEVRASDILRMDLEGNKLEGKWSVPPPILLHTEYHKAHPNTEVTIHQHPRYTTIWSACGRVPPPYDQRAAFIATDDIVLYDDYTGGVSAVEASRAAVGAMGSAPMALLRNHGAFVAADSMAQAYGRAIALEWRCKQAWFVEAIGGDSVMPEYGQQALAARNADARVITWNWAVRRELRADPDVLT
jgi:L-fuculose-phosphate aldolase